MDREKKKQQEHQEKIFAELMKDEANQVCADCGARGPKWASWNIGCFLCIRCGGFHRKIGTHISKIKSINLDTWTPEQIDSIRQKGNARANALFNPNGINPPLHASDRDLENFIRDKYERKSFMNSSTRNATSSQSSTVIANDGSNSRWSRELRQLHEMGFNHDPFNIRALEECNGNLQNAIEKLIQMGTPPTTTPSTQTNKPSLPARSNTSSGTYQVEQNSNHLQQLRNLGFTDEQLNNAAMKKANGNLELAISYLTDRRHELNASTAPSSNPVSNFTAASSTMKPTPSNPKNDLLGLLDDGPDPFGAPSSQGFSQSTQANPFFGTPTPQMQASPFGAMQTPQNPITSSIANPFGETQGNAFGTQQSALSNTSPPNAPQPSNANSILSLYNQPTKSQNPFGVQQQASMQPMNSNMQAMQQPGVPNSFSTMPNPMQSPFSSPPMQSNPMHSNASPMQQNNSAQSAMVNPFGGGSAQAYGAGNTQSFGSPNPIPSGMNGFSNGNMFNSMAPNPVNANPMASNLMGASFTSPNLMNSNSMNSNPMNPNQFGTMNSMPMNTAMMNSNPMPSMNPMMPMMGSNPMSGTSMPSNSMSPFSQPLSSGMPQPPTSNYAAVSGSPVSLQQQPKQAFGASVGLAGQANPFGTTQPPSQDSSNDPFADLNGLSSWKAPAVGNPGNGNKSNNNPFF